MPSAETTTAAFSSIESNKGIDRSAWGNRRMVVLPNPSFAVPEKAIEILNVTKIEA